MQKISYNEQYGMQQAVFEGYKLMTRREPIFEEIKEPRTEFDTKGHLCLYDGDRLVHVSRYALNEVVAVAQSYNMICTDFEKLNEVKCMCGRDVTKDKSWTNKMYVKPYLMPHQISITDIKVERLHDISEDDIMREGIMQGEFTNTWDTFYFDSWGDVPNHITFKTPHAAFAALIDKISGKGTWNRNPWVFAYGFELVK